MELPVPGFEVELPLWLPAIWGFPESWGYPNSWMVYVRQNTLFQIDDDWGYPYFRKPPFGVRHIGLADRALFQQMARGFPSTQFSFVGDASNILVQLPSAFHF